MPSTTYLPNDVGNQLIVVGPLRPGVDNSFELKCEVFDPVTRQPTGPYDFTGWNPGNLHIGTDNAQESNYQALVSVPYSFAPDRTSGIIQVTITFRHMFFVTPAKISQGNGGIDGYSPQGNLTPIADVLWFMREWQN